MPSPATVLITGGAGFVGSHLADELLEHGYRVRVLDNLTEQVHGAGEEFPSYLPPEVERIRGDVRDPEAVAAALEGANAVYHLAAAVGVRQSMEAIEHYADVNVRGTAVLLEALAKHPVDRLVVASSMSVYGEGLCRRRDLSTCSPALRTVEQLRRCEWELQDEEQRPLQPVETAEAKPPDPASIYALTKYDQERMCLLFGRTYGVPAVALRFFNIYGPRQALTNPYTGVLAIFSSRYLNSQPPVIFEDGLQLRDFVSVHDVKRACRLALECTDADGRVFNVGTGQRHRILDVAHLIGRLLGSPLKPRIANEYRAGDIRHCIADISRARAVLGYEPQVRLEEGLAELVEWLREAAPEVRDAEAAKGGR
jgi:dTDP-L-rhamnose 4-epimerase